MEFATDSVKWFNDNQGLVSVLIFVATLFLGWGSGIFASLRRKPKLRFKLITGPTLCTTFLTGKKHNDYDAHRTAISLYLNIANIGSAPTSIENVSIGYHWDIRPFSWTWVRYRIFWCWMNNQANTLQDFQTRIGEHVKTYPSLFQRSAILGTAVDTYLETGKSINGVVYFEQRESWGGCFPRQRRDRTKIIVAVTDAFGTKYKRRFWVPCVTLDEAKKYNPSFGNTLPSIEKDESSPPI